MGHRPLISLIPSLAPLVRLISEMLVAVVERTQILAVTKEILSWSPESQGGLYVVNVYVCRETSRGSVNHILSASLSVPEAESRNECCPTSPLPLPLQAQQKEKRECP